MIGAPMAEDSDATRRSTTSPVNASGSLERSARRARDRETGRDRDAPLDKRSRQSVGAGRGVVGLRRAGGGGARLRTSPWSKPTPGPARRRRSRPAPLSRPWPPPAKSGRRRRASSTVRSASPPSSWRAPSEAPRRARSTAAGLAATVQKTGSVVEEQGRGPGDRPPRVGTEYPAPRSSAPSPRALDSDACQRLDVSDALQRRLE